MMQGHKLEYVVFRLSYILWYMLTALFAVAYIYVMPYITVGDALYYEHICGYRNFSERKSADTTESDSPTESDTTNE